MRDLQIYDKITIFKTLDVSKVVYNGLITLVRALIIE